MPALGLVTLLVREYDEALAFYRGSLGFDLLEDTPHEGGRRWVVVRPPGADGTALLLARAATPEQLERVGDQAGGRVAFFLTTDDFAGTHRRMLAHGVEFTEQPRYETYGTVAVLKDLYGNLWDLVEPHPS